MQLMDNNICNNKDSNVKYKGNKDKEIYNHNKDNKCIWYKHSSSNSNKFSSNNKHKIYSSKDNKIHNNKIFYKIKKKTLMDPTQMFKHNKQINKNLKKLYHTYLILEYQIKGKKLLQNLVKKEKASKI